MTPHDLAAVLLAKARQDRGEHRAPGMPDRALEFDPYAVTWRYGETVSDQALERPGAIMLVEQVVAWATAQVES